MPAVVITKPAFLHFSFITKELDELTSSTSCAMYIGKLRDTLWPDGELDSTEELVPSEKQKAHTRTQARQALYDFLPGTCCQYLDGIFDKKNKIECNVLAVHTG